ncbi:hypothetical protein Hanom_Chr04g00297501 [Helianthus anomalus]
MVSCMFRRIPIFRLIVCVLSFMVSPNERFSPVFLKIFPKTFGKKVNSFILAVKPVRFQRVLLNYF